MGTDSMKVLVTGAKGQLGFDTVNELHKRGHMAFGVDREEMDITDAHQVEKIMQCEKPDAVIHCAAWTAVDAAEEPENMQKVYSINATGTKYIAEQCRKIGCKMMYLSTDYVFDGQGHMPWQADCKDYKPLNVYGKSKLDGELAVANILKDFFIVRIAWVFGKNGSNFIKTMLKLGETHDSLRVVCDQIGTPTYTLDLARLLVDMIETEKYGTYHATNEGGYISWAEFAEEIFHLARKNVKIIPVTTEEYGLSKATRPHNSRLDKTKLIENGFVPLPDWHDALERYLMEIGKYHAN